MRIPTTLSVVAVGAIVVAGLAGCTSPNDDAASTPTVTDTVTAAPQPTTSESTSATPASPATPATTTTPSATTGSGGAGSGTQACVSADLAASIASGSGGAAGSVYVTLKLTNKGTAACTLQGWPGVSLVGSGNGTQIGSAAKFDRSTSHATITVQPGSAAEATLQYVQADNYERSQCKPAKADGFRVFPPGNKASIFASYPSITGCKSTSVSLLTVGGLH